MKSIEQYKEQAKAKIKSIIESYEKPIESKNDGWNENAIIGETYFTFCNRQYWKGIGSFDEMKETLSIELVSKCLLLQDIINNLPYEKYNTLIETMDMIRYSPNNIGWDNSSTNGFEHSIIAYLIEADGNTEKALAKMIGENEIYEEYAAEIRATAF